MDNIEVKPVIQKLNRFSPIINFVKNHKKKSGFFLISLILYILWKMKYINFQRMFQIGMQRALKEMQNSMMRSQKMADKQQKLDIAIDIFYEKELGPLKEKMSEFYKNLFQIIQIKSLLKNKQNSAQDQMNLRNQLKVQTFLFSNLVLLTSRMITYIKLTSSILIAKYQDQLQGLLDQNINKVPDIFDQVIHNILEKNLPKVKEFIEKVNKEQIEKLSIKAARTSITLFDDINMMKQPIDIIDQSSQDNNLSLIDLTQNKELQQIYYAQTEQQDEQQTQTFQQKCLNFIKKQSNNWIQFKNKWLKSDHQLESQNFQYKICQILCDMKQIEIRKIIEECIERSQFQSHESDSTDSSQNLQRQNLIKGKQLITLIFQEFFCLINSTSFQLLFYYGTQTDIEKFQNLMYLKQHREENKNPQPLFSFLHLMYRFVLEEFLNQNSESNQENLYNQRYRDAIRYINQHRKRNIQQDSNQQNQLEQENQQEQPQQDNSEQQQDEQINSNNAVEPTQQQNSEIQQQIEEEPQITEQRLNDMCITTRILKESQNQQILNSSLHEFCKRIIFEKTIDFSNQRSNEDGNQILDLLGGLGQAQQMNQPLENDTDIFQSFRNLLPPSGQGNGN